MPQKVSIIILNWNSWKYTIKCLESLYQITYPNYDVILVDNGSNDESITKIRQYCEGKLKVKSKFINQVSFNKPIKIKECKKFDGKWTCIEDQEFRLFSHNRQLIILRNKTNLGCTKGNNLAMLYAMENTNPFYFCLLNNDTIVEPNFLSELVKVATSDTNIGIIGCKLMNTMGDIQFLHGFSMPDLLKVITNYKKKANKINYSEEIVEVDMVCGAAMLVKSDLIEKIGLLDEGFSPAYREELDWCLRSKKAGFKVIYNPKVKILHYRKASARNLDKDYLYYIRKKNIIRFRLLNYSVFYLLLDIPAEIIDFFKTTVNKQLKYWIKAYRVNIENIKEIIEKRKRRKIL